MQVLKPFVHEGRRYRRGDKAPSGLDKQAVAHYERLGMVGKASADADQVDARGTRAQRRGAAAPAQGKPARAPGTKAPGPSETKPAGPAEKMPTGTLSSPLSTGASANLVGSPPDEKLGDLLGKVGSEPSDATGSAASGTSAPSGEEPAGGQPSADQSTQGS